MKKTIILGAAIAAAALVSCKKEDAPVKQTEGRLITIEADIEQTRTSYEYADGAYKVSWQASDKLYVQDENGTKEQFTISSISDDKKKAVFVKEGSTLTDGAVYCWTRSDNTGLALCWEQKINWGMGSYECMSGTTSLADGKISGLTLSHDIAILRLTGLNFGTVNGTISDISLKSANLKNAIRYDLGTKTYSVSSSQDYISCVNVNAEVKNGKMQKDIYIAFFPQMTAENETYTLTFTLDGQDYSYKWTAGKKYEPGVMYTLKDKKIDITDYNAAIVFEDENVKTTLVGLYDTNKDGELSYAEADAVKSWDWGTFRDNAEITSFKEFQYFTSVSEIPYASFRNCQNLTDIVLPEGLTTIGESSFYKSAITSITIPESVTTIQRAAFDNCKNIKSITVPSNVTVIWNWAFRYLTGLESFTCLATMPPALSKNAGDTNPLDIFNATPAVPIKVPAGSVEAYKAAEGWSQYASRIEAL